MAYCSAQMNFDEQENEFGETITFKRRKEKMEEKKRRNTLLFNAQGLSQVITPNMFFIG